MIARWYEGKQPGQFIVPGGLLAVELDRTTGAVASEATSPGSRYTEYFLPGTEPAELKPRPLSIFKWGPVGG
jgi:hypothetical protein